MLYKSVGGNSENLFQSGLIATDTRTFVHVIDFSFHKHWLKQFTSAYITVHSLRLEVDFSTNSFVFFVDLDLKKKQFVLNVFSIILCHIISLCEQNSN